MEEAESLPADCEEQPSAQEEGVEEKEVSELDRGLAAKRLVNSGTDQARLGLLFSHQGAGRGDGNRRKARCVPLVQKRKYQVPAETGEVSKAMVERYLTPRASREQGML